MGAGATPGPSRWFTAEFAVYYLVRARTRLLYSRTLSDAIFVCSALPRDSPAAARPLRR
jgi:hypothetical protein